MIKVFDESEEMRASLQRAMGALLGDNTDIIFVNVEKLRATIDDKIRNATCPVIFYGMDSEISLRLQGNPAVPHFYSANGAYFRIPFQLTEIVATCQKIREGKKIVNTAVLMVSARESKDKLISILLHDIRPGKYGCEKALEVAGQEFGITGTTEEVCAKLKELQDQQKDKSTKDVAGAQAITGVFCDIEDTLIINNKVNQGLLKKLQKYAQTKPVTLWTGGDLEETEKRLSSLGITEYPLLSKYDFGGCQAEIVIDNYQQDEFKRKYRIKAKTYIQQK